MIKIMDKFEVEGDVIINTDNGNIYDLRKNVYTMNGQEYILGRDICDIICTLLGFIRQYCTSRVVGEECNQLIDKNLDKLVKPKNINEESISVVEIIELLNNIQRHYFDYYSKDKMNFNQYTLVENLILKLKTDLQNGIGD